LKFNRHHFLFLYSCLVFPNTDIYVDVTQDAIFVGDKIQVSIIARNPDIQKIELPQLDVDNEDISLSTISTDDRSLVLSLQFWRIGNYKFPSINIKAFNKDGTLDVFSTDLINFNVIARIGELENGLRNSKINKFFRLPFTINQLILSIIIFLSLIVAYILFNKRQKLDSPLNISRNIDLFNDALIELDQLAVTKEMDNKELEVFYISISDIIKKYLLGKFFFNANKMTTAEILNYLISNNIPNSGLKNLLEEADLCKFAQKKYEVITLLEAKKTAKTILAKLESESI